MYGYENHWFRSDRNEPMFPEISFQNFMLSKLCMAEFMSTTHCVSKLRRRLKSRHPKTLPNVTFKILNQTWHPYLLLAADEDHTCSQVKTYAASTCCTFLNLGRIANEGPSIRILVGDCS